MHRRMLGVLGAVLLCRCGNQTTPSGTQAAPAEPEAEAQADSVDTTNRVKKKPASATAFGDPLPGLTADELALFEEGKTQFQVAEEFAEGVGPVFNEASCVACHLDPAIGGSNGRLETRFGRRNADGSFDALVSEGGSLLQDHGIGEVAGFFFGPEVVPADANVVAQRRATPLFGLGLVDATPDGAILSIARKQARLTPETAGMVAMVPNVFTGGTGVGKFGWKNSNPTLLQFSADAYLNEMGITSPMFPDENCPQGRCGELAYNPVAGLNDADGADVFAFANFMTFLAPPPRGPGSERARAGERVFTDIGCAVCHLPTLVTGRNPIEALDQVVYHPYSDFLLHDMGSLGDGIVQAAAGARQMRTAPLWGMRVATGLLHDGRATTAVEAILAHDGQGRRARSRFTALGDKDREALLAFLDSL
jgi:CxxC motif-containing protein (DUF1111 family)